MNHGVVNTECVLGIKDSGLAVDRGAAGEATASDLDLYLSGFADRGEHLAANGTG